MNEVTLSNNLAQIELEINHHKQIAGQSIWEIGRRLNHVKEHDLAHGQFMAWYQGLGLDKDFVSKSMKIAKELPNFETLRNLGTTALHLIATLPAEEQQAQLSRIEQGDSPTVMELRHLKKKYAGALNRIAELESGQPVQPQVQVKEVIPSDYEPTKQMNHELFQEKQNLERRNEFLEQQLKQLQSQRAEVDEKSERYDELTKAIQHSQGQLNETQAKIGSYKSLLSFLRKGNELVLHMGGLVYVGEERIIQSDAEIRREFEQLKNAINRLSDDLNRMTQTNTNEILEGEIL
ncbi:DUF3102 domain-containing protein [Streptococcus suis]